jgi:hypothetical protein
MDIINESSNFSNQEKANISAEAETNRSIRKDKIKKKYELSINSCTSSNEKDSIINSKFTVNKRRQFEYPSTRTILDSDKVSTFNISKLILTNTKINIFYSS